MKAILFTVVMLSCSIAWNDDGYEITSTVIALPHVGVEQPVRSYDATAGGHIGIVSKEK